MKLTIVKKLFLGFGIIIALSFAGSLLNITSFKGIQGKAHLTVTESAPFALDAMEMKMCVIQIQQWMTDISATRGAEGFDDGFDEAKKYAARFKELLNKFREMFEREKYQAGLDELTSLEKDFQDYYNMGKKMADIYIQYGPVEGNKMMQEFDPFAEKMSKSIETFVDEQMNELNQSMNDILDSSTSGISTATLILILSLLAGILFAATLGRSIAKAIKTVVETVKDISEGEGDLTKKMDDSEKDEFGELAGHMNKLMANLAEMVCDVMDRVELVSAAASELAASSEQMSATAEEQSAQSDELTASTKEIENKINEVNENTNTASQASHSTLEATMAGKSVIEEASHSIVSLGKESQRIGEMVNAIADIAGKTDLLAINAAIEAANAGEHGKGFAVVADEVRKLAESTAKATNEITTIISTIRTSSSEAVQAMENAGNSMVSITQNAETTAHVVEQASSAAESQATDIKNIADIINVISASSSQFAAGITEGAKTAEELSMSAEDLRMLMGKFKVGKWNTDDGM